MLDPHVSFQYWSSVIGLEKNFLIFSSRKSHEMKLRRNMQSSYIDVTRCSKSVKFWEDEIC